METHCDLEVGGIDQFLNLQMCRKVVDICGQTPELVVATSLIEGTDGTGAKMSKSQGNYAPLTALPGEIMSVPDRLVEPYFRALSEWGESRRARPRPAARVRRWHRRCPERLPSRSGASGTAA